MVLFRSNSGFRRHMAAKTIGRFRVGRKLGSGNQGSVYLCADPELRRRVAIKLLDKTDLGSQEMAESFHREARTMSQIQHPNIVSIYEVGKHQGVPYLVFEFVEGRLLSEVIKSGSLEVAATLEVFQGLLEGMERAHRQGIVHRDLKPSNVIISNEGVPKVMDFGIARILSGQRDWDTQLIGSPRYMAPEYVEKGEVGTPADVFALGLILDEMLTGMPVFQGDSQRAVLESIVKDPVAPPSNFNRSVDERLDRIVLKAVEKDPEARYAHAGDFLQALQVYQGGAQGEFSKSGDSASSIEFLLRRMQRKSDFPALAQSIRTLNAMASTSDKDVGDMAKVIVKDFALTNKILKVVNSAYFGHFSGKIGTISRAVVVLGMQPIRSLAASLIFFEHLHDKTHAQELKAQAAGALYSAVLAGHVAAGKHPRSREEFFLTAMLQNLGKMLVTFYLRDEGEEIQRLIEQGVAPQYAQRQVLGVSFDDVGQGIARQWNFPDEILHTLKSLPPDEEVEEPEDLTESRRVVAGLANETAAWLVASPEQEAAGRRALLQRYGDALDLDGKQFNGLLVKATKEFLKLVETMAPPGREDPFVARLRGRLKDTGKNRKPDNDIDTGEDAVSRTQAIDRTQLLEGTMTPVAQGDKEALLSEGLQEVTSLLLSEPALPELCNVVVETMYRAMAFNRIVLCLCDRSGGQMSAKIGFGQDVEAFLKGFQFPLAWQADVFHAALRNNVDVHIADARDPKIKKSLPNWFGNVSDAGSFVLFPLVVRQKPVGLIYGDHPRVNGLEITGKTLNLLKALRNQIVLGFRGRM